MNYAEIATCLNLAALIVALFGDIDTATDLCHAQLRWIANIVGNQDNQPLYELAFQPWINLGRLLRIRGQHIESLKHFSLFLDCEAERPVMLGPIRIGSYLWTMLRARNSNLSGILGSVFVIDSIKAFLLAKAYSSALEFVHRYCEWLPDQKSYLSEGEVSSLANCALHQIAHETASCSSWGEDSYSQLVSILYQVIIATMVDRSKAARLLAAELGELVLARGIGDSEDGKVLRYLESVGLLNERMGFRDLAVTLYRSGYHASLRLCDEPYQLWFLDSLLRTPGISDATQLEHRRATLVERCLYGSVVTKTCRTGHRLSRHAIFCELVAEIRQLAM